MAADEPRRVDIAVCEKHGLRYNRAVDRGCALCRKEGLSAAASPPPRPAAPARPAAPSTAAAPPVPRPAPRAPAATPPPLRLPTATPSAGTPIAAAASDGPAAAAEARATTGARAVDIVTCEKHGLRYNRAAESGCVRCRRESGVTAVAGGTASGGRPSAPSSAEKPASAPLQVLIAALLVGGSGFMFYGAQQALFKAFMGSALTDASKATAEAAAAPASRKSFETMDPTDPAAWPTPEFDPRGHGPAEQQKQMHEFFQQMKEEEAKERGEVPGQ